MRRRLFVYLEIGMGAAAAANDSVLARLEPVESRAFFSREMGNGRRKEGFGIFFARPDVGRGIRKV